jgi:hypothetical protein
MNGSGYVPLDVLLLVLCYAACVAVMLRARRAPEFADMFRLAGWFVLSVRLTDLMLSEHDLPIGLPSVIALYCLALAEVTAAALYRRVEAP